MHGSIRELLDMPLRIGDGTAPPGFPAYASNGSGGVICRFQSCGHVGEPANAPTMPCLARGCACPCCKMLAGHEVHGCTYGMPRMTELCSDNDGQQQ